MGVVAYLSLSGSGREVGWGGRLSTFSAFRMGAYSRWGLIRGWALIRINTVSCYFGGARSKGFATLRNVSKLQFFDKIGHAKFVGFRFYSAL